MAVDKDVQKQIREILDPLDRTLLNNSNIQATQTAIFERVVQAVRQYKDDPEALEFICDRLDTQKFAFAQAVVANTPAEGFEFNVGDPSQNPGIAARPTDLSASPMQKAAVNAQMNVERARFEDQKNSGVPEKELHPSESSPEVASSGANKEKGGKATK